MWWGCSVAAQCPLTCKRPPEAECGANNTEVRSAPLFDYLPGPASNLSLLPCSVTMSPVLLPSLYYAEMSSSSLPSPCLSCITSSIEDSPFPSSQTSFIVPSPFLSLYTFISEFVSFFFFFNRHKYRALKMNYRCRRWTLIIYRAANAAGEWKLNIGSPTHERWEASHAWP